MVRACFILSVILIGSLAGCGPLDGVATHDDPMRVEFTESCSAQPEYARKRRDGSIDKYCGCIFDTVMKDLTQEQRILAGFYLYGEQSEAFKSRYDMNPDSLQHIGVVSKAIDRAVKTCR